MSAKKNKSTPGSTGAFETLPATHKDRVMPRTNVSVQSDQNVKESKDWVDFNKK